MNKFVFAICVIFFLLAIFCIVWGIIDKDTTIIVTNICNAITWTLLGSIWWDRIKKE